MRNSTETRPRYSAGGSPVVPLDAPTNHVGQQLICAVELAGVREVRRGRGDTGLVGRVLHGHADALGRQAEALQLVGILADVPLNLALSGRGKRETDFAESGLQLAPEFCGAVVVAHPSNVAGQDRRRQRKNLTVA